ASAPETYSSTRAGVRWADMTRTSWGMASASSAREAWLIVSQSDFEPMMIATSGRVSPGDMGGIVSGRALDHAAHGRLEHHLATLVGDLVPIGDDAAVGLLRLALVGDRHRHADGVPGEHGGHDADLAAEVRHARPVDETALDDQPLGQAERERARRRPALEHRLPRDELHVEEQRLGEAAEVHERREVRVTDGAPPGAVRRANLVLLPGQPLLDHGPVLRWRSGFGYGRRGRPRRPARAYHRAGPGGCQAGGGTGALDRRAGSRGSAH